MTRNAAPTRRPRERVLLCGAILAGQSVEHDGPLCEARGLAVAAGTDVIGPRIVQHVTRPSPSTLLGKGKVAEIAAAVQEWQPDAVIVDNDLTPAQVRNLEKAIGVRIIDRSELILDIFAARAETKQARLQVELAQEEYLLPRLRRMWTHLERLEGVVGTRGPGETQLETDKRLLRRRIHDLRHELKAIEQHKRRQVRSRSDSFTVGLVGYTNAGKSTLLNRLTGAEEFAADLLFSTLDTRTRQWKLPDGRTVLLSDTVGFLQRLPHHLVASFHATLEEALSTDLLLHVVDASHPDATVQMAAVDGVLASLPLRRQADVVVMNKIDLVPDPITLQLLVRDRAVEVVHLSARTGEGLERLQSVVAAHLDMRSEVVEITLPPSAGRTMAALRAHGAIETEDVAADGTLTLRMRLTREALGGLRRAAEPGVVFASAASDAR